MLEFIFEVLGEFLLQISAEALSEAGSHAAQDARSKPVNPYLAALGYALFGCLAGGLSLLVFESHFITNKTLQTLNLVLAPLASGLLMAQLGAWRSRRGQPVLRIDTFLFGCIFAFSFSVIRYLFAS